MNYSATRLIVIAGLLSAGPALTPAFAHGSHAGDGPHAVAPSHETHELQEKVSDLNKDIKQDNKKLTEDQQKLIVLQKQAIEAKAGKAPPLSPGQQHELLELQGRIGSFDKDIGRDTKQVTEDKAKLKTLQEQASH
jgi:hypothetical protein